MTPARTFNDEQRTRWDGADGEYWASHQERMDLVLQPVLKPLIEFAAPLPGSTVVDVGSGCGATTLELARAVGPSGRVVALDLSGPMIAVAQERLRAFPHTTFLHGDAAELPLKGVAGELMISRFGIMFFGDPVAAFSNLRTGLAAGGRLRLACWRPIHENPWLQIPLHAVYEHAPRLPKPVPEEPGPFSFGDPARVTRILTSAGFTAPTFTPLDIQMDLGGSLEEAAAQATEMGPAKRALTDLPEEVRAKAVDSVRRAIEPHVSANGVRLAGAVWLVAAQSS